MKLPLITLLLSAVTLSAGAQTRHVGYRFINRDSVNLPLNNNYELIEDNCSQIIRYGHFNAQTRKFVGKFKDVNKQKPEEVLSEGTYTKDGLKTGLFTSYYANGKPQSRGVYKDDKFDGRWELFNENGKSSLTFDASDNTIKILDAWDDSGRKITDNGKGEYIAKSDQITWKGKIDNGRPDGTWHAYLNSDASKTSIVTEHFKKGQFINGSAGMGEYTDGSRIVLVSTNILPYVNAEKFQISSTGCDGDGVRHIVNARYRDGWDSFNQIIIDAVKPVMSKADIKSYESDLVINGYVSERGEITSLAAFQDFDRQLSRGIITKLSMLPLLEPATADGKPIRQKFTITFKFHLGMYTFSYRTLNISQQDTK